MEPKPRSNQSPVNLKIILSSLAAAFLLIFLYRSDFFSSAAATTTTAIATISSQQSTIQFQNCQNQLNNIKQNPSCNKLSSSISDSLIHYATTKITPQQTVPEIHLSSNVLLAKSPLNFLIFGLGFDSPLWAALNHNGRTVFLEEDAKWIESVSKKFPYLESYHVNYTTKLHQSDKLLKAAEGNVDECKVVMDPRMSKCILTHKTFPSFVYDIEWDMIMVDAPTGFHSEAPGRMTAIYTSGLMARNRKEGVTDVYVHDVDRQVEDRYSKAFLCEGYIQKQEGRLRHFRIPSHRSDSSRPFCPLQ